MCDIKLLDCTLRDGGYVNDWKFGQDNILSIFERLVDSNVDIIEVGFLDEKRPFDIGRSIVPDTESINKIFASVDKKQTMVVGMIDFGTLSIEKLQPASETFLDGIRVIFKKHLMHEAMEYCRQVKALGYKVFSQLVSITAYNEDELKELASLVNDVMPYAVSIVDTYGLLNSNELSFYYDILENNIDKDVSIGFHAHNNLQLGFSNDVSFLNKNSTHNIVVDATLYGMGKSAGNTPIELVADYLNNNFSKNYNIEPMLEAIHESILDIYTKSPWGYNCFYYLCAKNRCHPNYLTYFMNKQELSASKLNKLLSKIYPEEKKLLYDKKVAEKIYNDFFSESVDEKKVKETLECEILNKKLLVVGPGKNIKLQESIVNDFIKKNDSYIIAINYIPENMHIDCLFLTNSMRYKNTVKTIKKHNPKIIATNNVECRNGEFDLVIHRSNLLEKNSKIADNSFLMLLNFLN